jgi:hypothetical protein
MLCAVLALNISIASAQCSCVSGAAIGGVSPILNSGNAGVLDQEDILFNIFYNYSYGDSYYKGSSKTEQGTVKEYAVHFTNFALGYGITDYLTLETQIGYYPKKQQFFEEYTLSGDGFSDISISGKYNFYHNTEKELDFILGLGTRIPVELSDDNLPQHLLSTTGAFAYNAQITAQKKLFSSKLTLAISNRTDFNTENDRGFIYGISNTSSFFIAGTIYEKLSGVFELRNTFRAKDKYLGTINEDSGGNVLSIAPQFIYSINDFKIAVLGSIPVMNYYNGTQLTNSFTCGVHLSYLYY